jgi:hypothetical protein
MCLRKTAELFSKVKRMTERVESLEARVAAHPQAEVNRESSESSPGATGLVGMKRVEEEYYLQLLCGQEVKRWKAEQEAKEKETEERRLGVFVAPQPTEQQLREPGQEQGEQQQQQHLLLQPVNHSVPEEDEFEDDDEDDYDDEDEDSEEEG